MTLYAPSLVPVNVEDLPRWLAEEVLEIAQAINVRDLPRNITVENPTSSENITMFFTSKRMVVSQVRALLANGSSSPSVTYQIKHDPDRSAVGNDLTASTVITNTTTGADAALDEVEIPADSWVWLLTTAQSGVTPGLVIFIDIAED